MDIDTRNNKSESLVSVVIPTCNSAKYIHLALASIGNQTYKNIELIVVDNFSADNTREIAKRYGAIVYCMGYERANQLTWGIFRAKGKYIYETGSDMVSERNYIKEAVEKCEKEGYDAIYSSVITKETKNFWGKVKALERECYLGDDEIEASHFFRHSVYDMVGGFDTSLISVEEDFQHRIDNSGFRTGRIKSREIHLHEAKTLKEMAIKSFYYGAYIRAYLKKHPKLGSLYLFPIRKAFIKNIPLFLKHPILTIGFVIYKLIQQTAGFLGLLFGNKNIHKRIYK